MKKIFAILVVAIPLHAETLSGLWCFDQQLETRSCSAVVHIKQQGDDVKASAVTLYEIDGKPIKLVMQFLSRAAGTGFCFSPILDTRGISLFYTADERAFITDKDAPVEPDIFQREVGSSRILRKPEPISEFCTPFPQSSIFIPGSEAKNITLRLERNIEMN